MIRCDSTITHARKERGFSGSRASPLTRKALPGHPYSVLTVVTRSAAVLSKLLLSPAPIYALRVPKCATSFRLLSRVFCCKGGDWVAPPCSPPGPCTYQSEGWGRRKDGQKNYIQSTQRHSSHHDHQFATVRNNETTAPNSKTPATSLRVTVLLSREHVILANLCDWHSYDWETPTPDIDLTSGSS